MSFTVRAWSLLLAIRLLTKSSKRGMNFFSIRLSEVRSILRTKGSFWYSSRLCVPKMGISITSLTFEGTV